MELGAEVGHALSTESSHNELVELPVYPQGHIEAVSLISFAFKYGLSSGNVLPDT